jgi:N-acetylmuramoyl-L-alanine amidase
MAKRIYLSPSNQRSNTYATGGTNEMVQCDKIAKATATALERCGFEVMVGKSGSLMQERCRESDAFKADIHMPIHTNACNGKVTGGTRIFCYSSSEKNMAPSKAILKTLGAISPGTGDSVTVRTDLYEINVPNAITVYVEAEFHDTKTGSDWIRNNIDNIGEAIAKGMCEHFNVTYKSPTATVPAEKKVLDTKGYKQGDSSTGVLALKELLRVAKLVRIHPCPVSEDNGLFGKSVTKAVNACLKKWGYKENGIAGENFIRKLYAEIKKKV